MLWKTVTPAERSCLFILPNHCHIDREDTVYNIICELDWTELNRGPGMWCRPVTSFRTKSCVSVPSIIARSLTWNTRSGLWRSLGQKANRWSAITHLCPLSGSMRNLLAAPYFLGPSRSHLCSASQLCTWLSSRKIYKYITFEIYVSILCYILILCKYITISRHI